MANFESPDGAIAVHSTNEWVEKNRKDFVPPVCNKCMFSDQLKVFFVGGPNSRRDYHLEEGEEIFYQIKGDMLLKVVEQGVHKDVKIREGEIFVLPAYVEHSPQRFADTLGCVVERDRRADEWDCIRYFTDDSSTNILWERWFHLKDVVKDLPPVIKEFNESEAKKRGKTTSDSFIREAPYKPNEVKLASPIHLDTYIDQHLEEINENPHPLFADQNTRANVTLYGSGMHNMETQNSEMVILFLRGEGQLKYGTSSTTIKAFYTTRVKPNTQFTLDIRDGVCLCAQILPK